MFIPTRESHKNEFYWKQPRKSRQSYDLLASRNEPVMRISWDAGFNNMAMAQTAEGIYLLRRMHFPRPCVLVQEEGKEEVIARLSFGWFGNAAFHQLEDKEFEWKCLDFWQSRYGWVDTEGNVIVNFRPRSRGGKNRMLVKFPEETRKLPQFNLLVMLGWYLVLNLAVNGIATPKYYND